MLVSAPLKNVITKGVLLGPAASAVPPEYGIREISEIHGDSPVIGKPLLKLIEWMSDYYIASEGVVLKFTIPSEVFAKRPRRKGPLRARGCAGALAPAEDDLDPVIAAAAEKKYRTILAHAPSTLYEYAMVLRILGTVRNVIAVVPEISHAEFLFGAAQNLFPERVCVLHGQISRGRRMENLDGIASGKYDVVVGTRPALFAPMRAPSLIAVLHEHSGSYKVDEGFRFHMRDVAVMRGFLERCPVLLSSPTPSVNSFFNAFSGKYDLIRPVAAEKRARVKVLDMRFEKKIRANISDSVFRAAASAAAARKKVLFAVNRRGYSTLLLCSGCGQTEVCGGCRVPLVVHNKEKKLRCHYCGAEREIPQRCGRCGSFGLELSGAGTERVEQDIAGLVNLPVFRIDSDLLKTNKQVSDMIRVISDDSPKALIGTRMMSKHLPLSERVGMAAVLNGDVLMNFPDFRAVEKAFIELSSLLEFVEPEGRFLIQTRFPRNPFFKRFREGDYLSVVKEELALRKSLLYPPYRKLLHIGVKGSSVIAQAIADALGKIGKGMEVLGPASMRDKKGGEEYAFLLRGTDGKLLRAAANAVLAKFGRSKQVRIIIDVDP